MPDTPASNAAKPIEFSQLGPDEAGNVHLHRPYFLLPLATGIEAPIGMSPVGDGTTRKRLTQEEYRKEVEAARVDALARIRRALATPGAGITDLYILSHGWHRNYFGAVSSYDRLTTRISTLLARNRLTVCENYKPLYICLQWSSEIGEDGWVDRAGRHDKPAYIEKVKKYFDDSQPGFLNTFEDVFELFSAMSAPDTDALAPGLIKNSETLAAKLALQKLLCPLAGQSEEELQPLKVCAAWTAYSESDARGVLSKQTTTPRGFAKGAQRVIITAKFLAGGLGALALLKLLTPKLGGILDVIVKAVAGVWHIVPESVRSPIDGFWLEVSQRWSDLEHSLTPFGLYAGLTVIAGALSMLVLMDQANRAEQRRNSREPHSDAGWLVLIPYLLAQIVFAVPVLLAIAFAFLFGRIIKPLPKWMGLSREKGQPKGFQLLGGLSNFARQPARAIARATKTGSLASNIAATADSQLAFYSMQQRAANAGEEAAEALAGLLQDLPALKNARLHLLGHSFGGIVVTNLARKLATRQPNLRAFRNGKGIETLCTIEGAYASGWFAHEADLVSQVDRTLASIYSVYDSATGFYYPFSNAGRFAAGSVGFSAVQKTAGPPEEMLWSAMDPKQSPPPFVPCSAHCQTNHIHHPLAYASLADPPVLPGGAGFAAINLDGSRMIYFGQVLSGGAHTDIYKDDVVHLMWAVAHRSDILAKFPPAQN
jgi:hypothetical protein